jgi:predicted mannosyl-3-phosphoglycerate phosphatase (HAD superfamily)
MSGFEQFIYNGEFDPGSGWTLAAGLIHASRGAARSSNILVATGKRVRNTYTTFLSVGDSPEKFGLIPHNILMKHFVDIKDLLPEDGCAYD